ncbi:hypothetical protein C0J52_28152 [Blattella germanica]|nr:hypothetical protein C0J52_28152 [Blattella germanica]
MSRNSLLSKSAIQLLSSGQDTDMVFEVVTSQEAPDCVIDHSQGQAVEATPAEQPEAEESACLNFISLNPDIMDSELFEELPQNLQAEIYDLVIWVKPRKSQTTEKLLPFPECPSPETPTSVSSSLADIEEMASNIHINSREVEASDSSSLEELPLTQDSARLESCLVQLRDIVGEQVSREELVQACSPYFLFCDLD